MESRRLARRGALRSVAALRRHQPAMGDVQSVELPLRQYVGLARRRLPVLRAAIGDDRAPGTDCPLASCHPAMDKRQPSPHWAGHIVLMAGEGQALTLPVSYSV